MFLYEDHVLPRPTPLKLVKTTMNKQPCNQPPYTNPEELALAMNRSIRRVRVKRLLTVFYGHDEADFVINTNQFTDNQVAAMQRILSEWMTLRPEAKKLDSALCFQAIQYCMRSKRYFTEASDQLFYKLSLLLDHLCAPGQERFMKQLIDEMHT